MFSDVVIMPLNYVLYPILVHNSKPNLFIMFISVYPESTHSKTNCTNIDFFVNWLANQSLLWAVYCEFMSGRLIALDMQTGVGPVGVGEAWICLIAKRALKATGPKATTAFQDD